MADDDSGGDLVEVTFVYDPELGSPKGAEKHGGKKFGVPKSRIPLPQRGVLFGQPGYSRQQIVPDPTPDVPDNTAMRWEWVLQGDTDPVDEFVDGLTGRPGWVVPQSRQVIVGLVRQLFSAGIPRRTIARDVPRMFAAVANEIRAEDAASPPNP